MTTRKTRTQDFSPPPVEIELTPTEEIHDDELALMPVFETKGLEQTDAEKMLESFTFFFKEMGKLERQLKEIVVETEDDIEGMELAKEIGKAAQQIRIAADEKKTELKEDILRRGNYIDNINRTIRDLAKGIEADASKKAKFVENKMIEKRNLLIQERSGKLTTLNYKHDHLDLGNMPDSTFTSILQDAEDLKTLRDERDKKLQEEQAAELAREQEKIALNELRSERLGILMKQGLVTDLDVAELSIEDFDKHVEILKGEKALKDRAKNRQSELLEMGLRYDKQNGVFAYDYDKPELIGLFNEFIQNADDKKWASCIKKMQTKIDAVKERLRIEQEEKIQKLAKGQSRYNSLISIGINKQLGELLDMEDEDWQTYYEIQKAAYDLKQKQLELGRTRHTWISNFGETSLTKDDLGKMNDEEWNELSDRIEKAYNKSIEDARLEQMDDSQRIKEYLAKIVAIQVPEVKSKVMKRRLALLVDCISVTGAKVLAELK
jgi:hypothetical protein